MGNMFENRETSDILFHEFIKCSRLIFSSIHGGKREGLGFGHHCEGHHGQGHHGQGRLLSILLHQNGITQKELAELLTITPASVSELINKLEIGGYIEKKQNEEDKRITNIFLTDGGKFFAEKMEENHTEIAKDIFSSLNEDEQKQLISLLQTLEKSLLNKSEGEECGFKHQHPHHCGRHGRGRCRDNAE